MIFDSHTATVATAPQVHDNGVVTFQAQVQPDSTVQVAHEDPSDLDGLQQGDRILLVSYYDQGSDQTVFSLATTHDPQINRSLNSAMYPESQDTLSPALQNGADRISLVYNYLMDERNIENAQAARSLASTVFINVYGD